MQMKHSVKAIVLALATIILVSVGSITSIAQCVKCAVNESTQCWECVASSESAAIRCPQVSCYNCLSDGVCIIQQFQEPSREQDLREKNASVQKVVRPKCDPNTLKAIARDDATQRMAPLKFDLGTIREIAAVHPRFAATLASLNHKGGLGYKVSHHSWTPVELKAEDVEWWFRPKEEAAPFFRDLNQRARSINKLILSGAVAPVVYEILVKESADSSTRVMTLRVVSNSPVDPPYSSLEIVSTDVGMRDASNKGQSTTSWRIN